MNAIDLLKSDHKKVSELLERLESQDAKTAKRLTLDIFEQLTDAVQAHTRMEERVFYPALEEKSETRALVEEFYKEHRQVDALLARLDKLKDEPSGRDWTAQLDQLKRSVEQHVVEEESELFPRAEQLLSAAELQEMFAEMARVSTGQSERDSMIYPASRLGPKG